ncbi:glycosyltransferase family 4 protein [Hydrogenimonas sp.]|uniref:glycosyltransferase family 4 protein n=1 Tax=Hydrogenimonas sp. TaxID=2231112 RepID=UPI002638EE22|nr:glycosyltransferase family 4 protein [Hydrogenimonas sp.]
MKILHTETLPKWGGQQNKVLKELKAARSLGHDVFLVCNPGAVIGERARSFDIPVTEIRMTKKTYHQTVPALMRFIQSNEIDIVVSHGSTDSWIVAVAGNLSKRKPFLIRERHNLFPIKGTLSRWQHRSLFDRIIAISESVKNYLLEIGVPENKIFFLPSTVDTHHFDATEEILTRQFDIPEHHTIVGMFADLTRKKGVFDFAEAASILLKRHADITVVFAGSYLPRIKEEIDALLEKYGLNPNERIVWTGRCEDAATIMKGFDIYIYPSHTEGLGTVIIEGMAAKLPLIVYDIEPMNRLVENGVRGLTAPYKNPGKLAECATHLIENEMERRTMARAAHDFVLQNYSDDILVEKMEELLEGVHGQ